VDQANAIPLNQNENASYSLKNGCLVLKIPIKPTGLLFRFDFFGFTLYILWEEPTKGGSP